MKFKTLLNAAVVCIVLLSCYIVGNLLGHSIVAFLKHEYLRSIVLLLYGVLGILGMMYEFRTK
jgi:hypothetical protein